MDHAPDEVEELDRRAHRQRPERARLRLQQIDRREHDAEVAALVGDRLGRRRLSCCCESAGFNEFGVQPSQKQCDDRAAPRRPPPGASGPPA